MHKPRLRRKLRVAMHHRFRPFSRLSSPVSSVPDSVLATRLEAARQELLDLGLRNPLLHFRPSPARGVAVVGEEAAAVYGVLVRRGKTM